MTTKQFSIIGLIAPVWFWLVYLAISSLRPEYSFLTKAISELGSIDAPYKWAWNIFGYCIPGLMIALFSVGLFASVSVDGKNKLPFVGILGSGLFMTLSGVFPMDMETRASLTSAVHVVGSFGSYIFFLIGAFTFPKQMKKSDYWQSARVPLLVFVWLTILFGAWPFIFPHMPAVGQRAVFLFYFCWIFYAALKLHGAPISKTVDRKPVVS